MALVSGRTQRRGAGAKDVRRDEGVARNAAWQGLTKGEKLASLGGRRGASRRQVGKLTGGV
jgi:hypothetical protein